MKISAALITFNEEKNIQKCLRSLSFADEIIVVDTGSSDKTVKIARALGAKIYKIHFKDFSNAKNFAISKTKFPWVISIDADEEVTPELKTELLKVVNEETGLAGYYIKRETLFLGKRIKHCGWNKDYQLRLFKKNKGAFNGKPVHESIEVKGGTGRLKETLLHYSYPDSRTYFEKMNRYTTLQAEEKQKGFLLLRMLTTPFAKFFRMYFLKAGFLDGKQGFILCVYSGFSEFVKFSKMRLFKIQNKVQSREVIVIRMPNWLGDAVMATIVLKPIKALYKKIVVICDVSVRAIFEKNPYIDELISFDKRKVIEIFNVAAKIKKMKPAIAVSLTPSFSSAFMLWLTGAKIRAGFSEDMGGGCLNRKYIRDTKHASLHLTEEYEKVFYMVDTAFDFEGARQELATESKQKEQKIIKKFGFAGKKKIIMIAPFVKYGQAKMWPVENWEKLISALLDRDADTLVCIAGTKQDLKYTLSDQLKLSKRIIDLRGKTNLEELIVLLKCSKTFIGNDSGLMHVADALKVPVLGIFASTSAKWTGPLNNKSKAVTSGIECAPCFDKTCRYGHYKCMKQITPEKILKLI